MTQPVLANNDISPAKHSIILMIKPAILRNGKPMGRLPGGRIALGIHAMNHDPFLLGVVILGAGRSSRMGRPKLLLPWGETSVIGHLIQQWQMIGANQITVVSAVGDVGMIAELDRLGFAATQRIVNPDPERGMFSSIQCAAGWPGWQPNLTHRAIVLGDQPHLALETLRSVIDFSAANSGKICQPRKNGHRYHPVVLPKDAFERVHNSHTTNLKEFLALYETAYCDMTDPGLELDIDRPEDYEKALKLAKTSEI
jgi:molybdenum cofactor cytidylyltransferase